MRFVKTEGTDVLTRSLVKALIDAMDSNLKTLWLVPGGSNIPVVVDVMSKLPQKNLHRLTIMLSDERYGKIGHEDSNYYQIMQAGLLDHDAEFVQTLTNSPLTETVDYANKAVEKLLGECGAVIGFFGMGADGHTAGILPGSTAAASENYVEGYDAGEFTRITLTPKALKRVTKAFVGAFGPEKKPALTQLRDDKASVEEQPAQIFKQVHDAAIFNDQIGESE